MESEITPDNSGAAPSGVDHWPTYWWRPACGFSCAITFVGNYFVLPLLKIPPATIPTDAWMAIGGILGVASFFRGKAQADPNVNIDQRG